MTGHETPAQAMVWALHSLSHAPEIQHKLRLEAQTILSNSATPTLDELNSLPYLDKVIREALRLHSPGAWIERTPHHVDCIPVDTPYEDRYGNMRDHIVYMIFFPLARLCLHLCRISPGDKVRISVRGVNCRKDIWGPDALEFKYVSSFLPLNEKLTGVVLNSPDRWDNIPKEAEKIPGIVANSIVFSTGPRGCIGFRFAIAE